MTRPDDAQRAGAIRGLVGNLEATITVLPILAEHSRRERWHPDGRLPTAKVTCEIPDCTGRPHGTLGVHAARLDEECQLDHADPTGEAVIAARPSVPSYDRDRLDAFDDALADLIGAARGVLNQLPAVTLSVRAGRPPTSGQSADQERWAKAGAVEAESACLACDLGVSEVGQLKAGLCAADHRLWTLHGCPSRGSLIADGLGEERWTPGWIRDYRISAAEHNIESEAA